MQIKLRDLQILNALSILLYMTTQQIQELFWTESRGGEHGLRKACERRMRLLHKARLVRRIEQPTILGEGTKPFIYAISRQGADLLVAELGIDPKDIDWRPKSQEHNYPFLEHALLITDFRIALQKACPLANVGLAGWLDEKELRKEGMTDQVTLLGPNDEKLKTAVIPDAAFLLDRDGKKALFFVEIDRGTVTIQPSVWERKGWSKKLLAYQEYMKTEAYMTRYEGRQARVLTITTSQKRLDHIQHLARELEDAKGYLFTTFDLALEPTKLLTEPIWSSADSNTLRSLL